MVADLWCRRRDLNPHAPKGTSPSSWRVCLFRHSDADHHSSRECARGYESVGRSAAARSTTSAAGRRIRRRVKLVATVASEFDQTDERRRA